MTQLDENGFDIEVLDAEKYPEIVNKISSSDTTLSTISVMLDSIIRPSLDT